MSSFRKVASLWLRKAISEKHVKNLQKIKEEDLPFDHLFSGKRRQVIEPKDFGGLATGSEPESAKDLQKFLRDTDILEEGDEIDWKNGKILTKDGETKSRLGKGINKGIRKSVGGDKKLFADMAKVKKGLGKNETPMNMALGARWKDSIRGLVGMAHLFDPEFPTEDVWKELTTYGVPSDSGWKQIRKIADQFAKLSPDKRKEMRDRHDDAYQEAEAKSKQKRFETPAFQDFRDQYWNARGLFSTHVGARTEKDTEWMLSHFNKWKDRVDELYESEDGDTIRSLYDEAKKTSPERLKALKDLSSVEDQANEYNLWKGTYGEELAIVLSRDPLDVLRMSDHPKAVQKIESCHSEGGSEFSCAIEEAEEGGLIAYVVKKKDLEGVDLEDGELFEDHTRKIKGIKPVSRLRLRRFEKENKWGEEGDGLEVAIPEIDTYGAGFPKFVNVMTEWARKEQPGFYTGDDDYSKSPGDWKLTGGEYQDTPSSELFQNFFGRFADHEDSGPTEDQYDPYGEGYTEDDSPYYDPDADEDEDESEADVSVKKVRPGKVPPQEFWEWMDKHHSQVPNPNSRGREDKITPSTLKGYARGRTNYSGRAQNSITRYMTQYEKLREKADSGKKVATTWLRQKIAAKYSPQFYQTRGIKRYPNPDTGNDVLFYNLPQHEKDRMYAQWERRQKTPLNPKQRAQLTKDMRQDEREQEEAEAAAGQADRKELAKKLKELKNKKLPARILKKEKMRLVQEIESRALAREQARKEKAKKVASLWLRSQIVKYEGGI